MRQLLARFRRDDCGAVTVDWVVLTAAMAMFGAGIAYSIREAATDPSSGIGAELTSFDPIP